MTAPTKTPPGAISAGSYLIVPTNTRRRRWWQALENGLPVTEYVSTPSLALRLALGRRPKPDK